jgi:lysophospholipase L1-like esterase
MIELELIKNIPVLLENPFLEPGDRLVCFGDSLTADDNGYRFFLQQVLEKQNIEVINAGVNGDKTTTALPRIIPDVLEKKPTAVSLYFGTNDACHGHGRWSHEPQVSWQALRDNLKWMVHICRLSGIKKFSINALPGDIEGWAFAEYGERYHHNHATRLAAEEAKTLFVPLDYVFREGAKYHINDRDSRGYYYTKDGIHHTPECSELIAKTMLHCWKMADI